MWSLRRGRTQAISPDIAEALSMENKVALVPASIVALWLDIAPAIGGMAFTLCALVDALGHIIVASFHRCA